MGQLRLVFQRHDSDVTVRADFTGPAGDSIIGGESQPFAFELTAEDYIDLRWYLEEYMDLPAHGNKLRANRIEQALTRWGRDLYRAVFDHGDHRDLIRNLLAALLRSGDGERGALPRVPRRTGNALHFLHRR